MTHYITILLGKEAALAHDCCRDVCLTPRPYSLSFESRRVKRSQENRRTMKLDRSADNACSIYKVSGRKLKAGVDEDTCWPAATRLTKTAVCLVLWCPCDTPRQYGRGKSGYSTTEASVIINEPPETLYHPIYTGNEPVTFDRYGKPLPKPYAHECTT